MKYTGLFILSLWLILQGILSLMALHFPYQNIVLPLIALIAGAVLLFHSLKIKLGDMGILLLSIWLILRSSMFLLHYSFQFSNMILAILGIVAGLFLISKK